LANIDFTRSVLTKDDAFIRAKRNYCGFIYADASSLRELAVAFKRDDVPYSFVESWSSTEDFANAKNAVLVEQAKRNADEEAARQRAENERRLAEVRKKEEGVNRRKATDLLQQQSGPRVRGLLAEFEQSLDQFLEKEPNSVGQDSIATLYPTFAKWYRARIIEGWELQKRDSVEIVDFGRSVWNERSLETTYLRLNMKLKNRVIGVYDSSCWVFSRVEDTEFKMYRMPVVMRCDGSDSQITMQKQRTTFRSEWFAP
jgi:hypothetical protein